VAISATFVANFSSFQAAVDQAQTTLKDFGDGADRVGATLNRMVDNFSGRKLIQQATEMAKAIEDVGGVSMLTDQELQRIGATVDQASQKMEKLGIEVPPAFTAITDAAKTSEASWEHLGETITKAFEDPLGAMKQFGSTFVTSITDSLGTVGVVAVGAATALAAIGVGLFELTEKAAGVGAAFNDMAESTGLTAVQASQLSTAVELAGGNVDTMTNAIFQLQKRMDEGGPAADKVAASIEKLGINVTDFQALNPGDQILALSDGFRNLDPSISKAGIAFDLFGRQGRDMLPTLMKPLQDLIDTSKALGATWTEEETKAAEDFEIQMRTLEKTVTQLGISFGKDLIPVVSWLLDHFVEFDKIVLSVADKITGMTKGVRLLGDAYAYAAAGYAAMTGKTDELPGKYKDLATASEAAAKAQQDLNDALFDKSHSPDALVKAWKDATTNYKNVVGDGLNPLLDGEKNLTATMKDLNDKYLPDHKTKLDAANKAAADAAAAEKKLNDQLIAIEGNGAKAAFSIVSTNDALAGLGQKAAAPAIQDVASASLRAATDVDALRGSTDDLQRSGLFLEAAMAKVNTQFTTLPNVVPLATKALAASRVEVDSLSDAIGKNLSHVLDNLPSELERAFASGNVSKAMADVGIQIGQAIEKPILASLSDANKAAISAGVGISGALGSATEGKAGAIAGSIAAGLGGAAVAASSFGASMAAAGVAGTLALGATTLGIGAAAVGVVALIKHFTSLSQAEKDGRALEAQFEQSFGGVQQMIDAVGAAYTNTGQSATSAQTDIKALFDAEKGGAPAVQAAIDKITNSLDASAKKTQDVATGVDSITAAATTLGGTVPTALQPLLKTLESLPGLTDAEKTSLDGLLGSGQTDYASLTKMAAGYGLTVDQLGPKFEQADISSRADQIVKDFQSLTDAGADAGNVMGGMATQVSALVDNAIQYGSTLPTALKPIIDNLAAAGKLTDSTGKKLDDLSGITFDDASDPLAKGLASLTDAINNLITLLSGLPATAATAAAGISANLSKVQVQPVTIPFNYAQQGPSPSEQQPETHASGGIVGMGGGFPGGPVGTDTVPAWLTPGERVLTVAEQQALAAGGGSSDIHIEVPVTVDGREIARVVTDYQSRDLQSRRKLSAA
jgi:hypothetical protein